MWLDTRREKEEEEEEGGREERLTNEQNCAVVFNHPDQPRDNLQILTTKQMKK